MTETQTIKLGDGSNICDKCLPIHYPDMDEPTTGWDAQPCDYCQMTLTRETKTGCTCVGDLRLSALDVGFDLRSVGHAITLPDHFESVGLDIAGETILLSGPRDELVAAIIEAGYSITPGTEKG